MSVVDEVFASLGLDEPEDTGTLAKAVSALAARPGRPRPPRPGSTVDIFKYKSRDGASVRRVVTAVTRKKKLWQYLIEHHVNHRADCNAYAFDDNNAFMAKYPMYGRYKTGLQNLALIKKSEKKSVKSRWGRVRSKIKSLTWIYKQVSDGQKYNNF